MCCEWARGRGTLFDKGLADFSSLYIFIVSRNIVF